MNIHWQNLVTEAQRFATVHDVDANFLAHRARRPPPMQHDEKTQKKTVNVVLSGTDHYRIGVYYTIMDTDACQIQDCFQDDMLGIFEEMDHFTPRKLVTEDHVPTDSIGLYLTCAT